MTFDSVPTHLFTVLFHILLTDKREITQESEREATLNP